MSAATGSPKSASAVSEKNVKRPSRVGLPDRIRRRLHEIAVAGLGIAQLALEALAVRDVARRAVDAGEGAVVADADRLDLERHQAAVAPAEDEAVRSSTSGAATSFAQRSAASAAELSSTRTPKCDPTTSSVGQPSSRSSDSLRNVKRPSASVAKTTSGEFSTRNR